MRRIIIALSMLTLTACVADETSPDADVGLTGERPRATSPEPVPGAPSAPLANADAATRSVLFIGTSLTAGYGVGEDVAYPARLQQRIDSAGLPFRVVNAGISGETSAGGLRRVDWSLQHPVDVLVVELGANDGLRGLPVDQLRSNLDGIMTRARAAYPDIAIVLLGMEAPPNLGDPYTSAFRRVYADLAEEHDAAFLPFLLEGVAAEPALNIEDGIHPNEAGHRFIAENVWAVLEPVLRRRAAQLPSSDDS